MKKEEDYVTKHDLDMHKKYEEHDHVHVVVIGIIAGLLIFEFFIFLAQQYDNFTEEECVAWYKSCGVFPCNDTSPYFIDCSLYCRTIQFPDGEECRNETHLNKGFEDYIEQAASFGIPWQKCWIQEDNTSVACWAMELTEEQIENATGLHWRPFIPQKDLLQSHTVCTPSTATRQHAPTLLPCRRRGS